MAEEEPSIIGVVSVFTNGRRNPDGSRVVEGVRFLTTQGAREIFVRVVYDQDGNLAEEERPLVDALAKMFFQTRAAHSIFSLNN